MVCHIELAFSFIEVHAVIDRNFSSCFLPIYNWGPHAISSFLINAAKNELIIDHIFKHMIISTNFLGMQID